MPYNSIISIQTRIRQEAGPAHTSDLDIITNFRLQGSEREQFVLGNLTYRFVKVTRQLAPIDVLAQFAITDPTKVTFLHVAAHPSLGNGGNHGYRFEATLNGVVIGRFGQLTLADGGGGLQTLTVAPQWSADRTVPEYNVVFIAGLAE